MEVAFYEGRELAVEPSLGIGIPGRKWLDHAPRHKEIVNVHKGARLHHRALLDTNRAGRQHGGHLRRLIANFARAIRTSFRGPCISMDMSPRCSAVSWSWGGLPPPSEGPTYASSQRPGTGVPFFAGN